MKNRVSFISITAVLHWQNLRWQFQKLEDKGMFEKNVETHSSCILSQISLCDELSTYFIFATCASTNQMLKLPCSQDLRINWSTSWLSPLYRLYRLSLPNLPLDLPLRGVHSHHSQWFHLSSNRRRVATCEARRFVDGGCGCLDVSGVSGVSWRPPQKTDPVRTLSIRSCSTNWNVETIQTIQIK